MQAIERRREATAAANEYSQVNHSNAARELTQQDAEYNRFYAVDNAKRELQELRDEIQQQQQLFARHAGSMPAA
eukprot:2780775-Pleurochrysis_carterae.AAC.1